MASASVLANLANPSGSGGRTANQTVPGGSQNTNPLGGSVFNTLAQISPTVATLPSYPGTGVTIPGGVAGAGTTPTTAGGGFTTGNVNPNAATTQAGSKTMLGDFQQTYGQGTGTAIANVLGSLGTTTSSAEQLMLQPTEMAANMQLANIQAGQAAAGVSADSSTAALTAAGLGGQESAAIAGEMGTIGLNEEQMLLGALTGEGTKHGSDVSGWQQFGDVMQGIGNAAMGVAGLAIPGGGSLGGSLLSGLFGHR